jgi:nucleotide-binding universal stress UspA family protein
MTIVVAYAPRPDGQAALEQGIEEARRRQELLVVVNASPHGGAGDPSAAVPEDLERVERQLQGAGIAFEFRQFVRGKSAAEEIEWVTQTSQASLLVIGMRKRSVLGKLILGSVAQQLLLTVECPVLVVKAG